MATNLDKAQTVGESLEFGIGGPGITKHSGSPEGAVTAPIGSLVLRTDDGSIWKKVSGAGNTGWVDASSGSTSGYPNINYITNYGAESDVSGASAYADTAGSAPIDATGGSPTVTITRTTSSPQRGTASYLMTKDSVNRQGEGFSIPFTIDSADKAAMLQIGADIIVGSGTFNAGSNTTDSDATVWIYDVTNSRLIQPTNHKIFSNSSILSFPYSGTFQASPDSTSYRLIFHVGTTNASAWTLKIDNVVVGPMLKTITSAVSDSQSYTPSSSIANTSGNLFRYQRIGDLCRMSVGLNFTGTGAVTYTLAEILPPGLSIDYDKLGKLTGTTPDRAVVGFYTAVDVGTASYANIVYLIEGTEFSPVFLGSYFTPGNTDGISMTIEVPISGWGSNVELNSMDSNRPVHARYTGTISANSSSSNPIQWSTKDYDTHNAVTTGSSWKFTAPISGYYVVLCSFATVSAQTPSLYKQGVHHSYGMTINTGGWIGNQIFKLYLKSGEYIDVRYGTSETVPADSKYFIAISKDDSATQIGANETVAASYYCSANDTTVSTSASINFDTMLHDTHNAVTVGSSWKFTAPLPGVYRVYGLLVASSGSGQVPRLLKNGGVYIRCIGVFDASYGFCNYCTSVKLMAGDYIEIRCTGTPTILGGDILASNISHINVSRE